MELFQLFNFLFILRESIKLLYKNGKFIAPIAIVSYSISSFSLVLFIYLFQFFIYLEIVLQQWALILVIGITFFINFSSIFFMSRLATTLVSTMSYTGKRLSSRDLFYVIKMSFRGQLSTSYHTSLHQMPYLFVIATCTTFIYESLEYTPIYILVILGVSFLIHYVIASIIPMLAVVVSVVEDNCYGKKALERAAEVVEGQGLEGFMLNFVFTLLVLILIALSYYEMMIMGLGGFMNFTVLVINVLLLRQIFESVAHTVFYFQCKQHQSEEEYARESLKDYRKKKFGELVRELR